MLQWSHSLSAMETCKEHLPAIDAYTASMEPQPFGYGNHDTYSLATEPFTGFNGATAFRLWKRGFIDDTPGSWGLLQWSHSLSAMETRIENRNRPAWSKASMEPQPFGYGNVVTSPPYNIGHKLQWSHSLSAMETCRIGPNGWRGRQSFNGATAFRLWKPWCGPATPTPATTLQWSHSLSAMETWFASIQSPTERRASMEPQPFGYGNSQVVPGSDVSVTSFNGATAFRLWKPPPCQPTAMDFVGASMEPQPFGYGNQLEEAHHQHRCHASMEPQPFGYGNGENYGFCTAHHCASMEPQPFGYGNQRMGSHYIDKAGASMEPQPFGYGNCYSWLGSALVAHKPASFATFTRTNRSRYRAAELAFAAA